MDTLFSFFRTPIRQPPKSYMDTLFVLKSYMDTLFPLGPEPYTNPSNLISWAHFLFSNLI